MFAIVALIIANLADCFVTAMGITAFGSTGIEANPLGRMLWDAGGVIGLVAGKMLSAGVVIVIAETVLMAGHPRLSTLVYVIGIAIPLGAAATWMLLL